MSTHESVRALMSTQKHSGALRSMMKWCHEFSLHHDIMLMSTYERSRCQRAKLMSVYGYSGLLSSVHSTKAPWSWLLMAGHLCHTLVMSAYEPSWTAMSCHEHYWAALSSNEHSWAMHFVTLSTHEHSWAWYHGEMSTYENSWHHFTILMSASECFWVLMNAHEPSWALMRAHALWWVLMSA